MKCMKGGDRLEISNREVYMLFLNYCQLQNYNFSELSLFLETK